MLMATTTEHLQDAGGPKESTLVQNGNVKVSDLQRIVRKTEGSVGDQDIEDVKKETTEDKTIPGGPGIGQTAFFGTSVSKDQLAPECESSADARLQSIHDILDQATSDESKDKIEKIVIQVEQLTDLEKLLLYLRLPTGSSIEIDPLKQIPGNPLGNRYEVTQTINWIRTHLQEDPDVSLPKHEVYTDYQCYCALHKMKPLSTADFGKVMKYVFPKVRPRRLGTRGNSKYCYAGLRKRIVLDSPALPDVCVGRDPAQKEAEILGNTDAERDMLLSASHLIREWSSKILDRDFSNLQELAWFLVETTCVDSQSAASFTLLPHLSRKSQGKLQSSILLQSSGGRHRETQLKLQRQLQERENIREQKRKHKQQRHEHFGGEKTSPHEKGGGSGGRGGRRGGSNSRPITPSSSRKQSTCTRELDVTEGGGSASAAAAAYGFPESVFSSGLTRRRSEGGYNGYGKGQAPLYPSPYGSARTPDGSLGGGGNGYTVTTPETKCAKVPIPRISSGQGNRMNPSVITVLQLPVQDNNKGPNSQTNKMKPKFKPIQPKPMPEGAGTCVTKGKLKKSISDVSSELKSLLTGAEGSKENGACAKRRMDPGGGGSGIMKRPHLDPESLELNAADEASIGNLESEALMEYMGSSGDHDEEILQYFSSEDDKEMEAGLQRVTTDASATSDKMNQSAEISQLRQLLEKNLQKAGDWPASTSSSNILSDQNRSQLASDTVSMVTEESSCVYSVNSSAVPSRHPSPGFGEDTSYLGSQDYAKMESDWIAGMDFMSDEVNKMEQPIVPVQEHQQPPQQQMVGSVAMRRRVSFKPTLPPVEGSEFSAPHDVRGQSSVPPSPNTSRRMAPAFSFMPISPRQTPQTDAMMLQQSSVPPSPGGVLQMSANPPTYITRGTCMSQPPSAAGSPFVSPRSTPVPHCRSRHNSGQAATPLRVSVTSESNSSMSSPYISRHVTPVQMPRSRHNSNQRTMSYGGPSTNPIVLGMRSRHSSGTVPLMSPQSAPLSPMGHYGTQIEMPDFATPQSHFTMPSIGGTPEVRSRHNSNSSVANPISPRSAPLSPMVQTGVDSVFVDPCYPVYSNSGPTMDLEGLGSNRLHQLPPVGSLKRGRKQYTNPGNSNRQRHASMGTITMQHYASNDAMLHPQQQQQQFAPNNMNQPQQMGELEMLMDQGVGSSNNQNQNRCQSVPLYQMQESVDVTTTQVPMQDPDMSKSYPTTPTAGHQSFHFPPQQRSTIVSSHHEINTSGAACLPPFDRQPDLAAMRLMTQFADNRNQFGNNRGLDENNGNGVDDIQPSIEDLGNCVQFFEKDMEDWSGENQR